MEFVNPEGLRRDGRRPKEVRSLNAELNVLKSADGSAIFQMGNTKVLAAVFGPKAVEARSQTDASKAIVRCEYAMAAFSTGERRRRGKMDRRSTELSMVIKNALEQTILLELLPKTQIDIYVQVIQADGGTRCACINAAFLALADAGVPMKDIVASCAAGYLDNTPLLDLNYMEDSGGGPDVALAWQPKLDKIVLLQSDNRVNVDVFEEVAKLAQQGCQVIAEYMREQLLVYVEGRIVRQRMNIGGAADDNNEINEDTMIDD